MTSNKVTFTSCIRFNRTMIGNDCPCLKPLAVVKLIRYRLLVLVDFPDVGG